MTARMRRRMAAATALALLCSTTSNAQGLSFFWYFDTQNDFTIPSCANLAIGLSPNPNATVPAVPPYYLISYAVGQVPAIFPASFDATSTFYWRTGYPQGTQIFLSFIDSQGNSGGVGPLYTIVGAQPGEGSCPMYTNTDSPFSFTMSPATQPSTCQNMVITPSGGTAPYTLSLVIGADSPRNQTYQNSTISMRNPLTAGGNFVMALSDSTGQYALSSPLIYSAGGSDTSCLSPTTNDRKSGGPRTPTSDGGGHKLGAGAIVGITAAFVAALALAAFLVYRRRKRRQQEELLRHNSTGAPPSYPGSAGPSTPGGSWGGLGGPKGREKYGMGGGAGAGGMWRPESPTEYPGITSAPVRFRVTNPDDDSRSEFSMRTGGATHGGGASDRERNRRQSAGSVDTVRTRSTSHNEGEEYHRRTQRRSLIEGDANAHVLYPPRPRVETAGSGHSHSHSQSATRQWATLPSHSAHSPMTPDTPASQRPLRGPPSASFDDLSDAGLDVDAGWPTYSSAASTSTEDHYMDEPASSAAALGRGRALHPSTAGRLPGMATAQGQGQGQQRARRGSGRTDSESTTETLDSRSGGEGYDGDEYDYTEDEGGYTPSVEDLDRFNSDPEHLRSLQDPYELRSGSTSTSHGTPRPAAVMRSESTGSNAYGSPFADSQRVR